jgi:hypothetical protein
MGRLYNRKRPCPVWRGACWQEAVYVGEHSEGLASARAAPACAQHTCAPIKSDAAPFCYMHLRSNQDHPAEYLQARLVHTEEQQRGCGAGRLHRCLYAPSFAAVNRDACLSSSPSSPSLPLCVAPCPSMPPTSSSPPSLGPQRVRGNPLQPPVQHSKFEDHLRGIPQTCQDRHRCERLLAHKMPYNACWSSLGRRGACLQGFCGIIHPTLSCLEEHIGGCKQEDTD